ncbi:MAG: NAD(P)H-hydrate dehydratase [Clostridia bacterium]|nr:NAD(P)H-hydrate dehydratase [Clostridia bacterium]
MIEVLSVKNMRESDAATIENVGSKELMKKAGEAISRAFSPRGEVAIVCGTGNNAGDGFVVALCLMDKGILPHIFLLEDKFSPDGEYFFNIAKEKGVAYSFFTPETLFSGFGTIVDCIFGTGFKGAPKGIYEVAINRINESPAFVVSADINSGLNGDSGMGDVVVKSDLTVSVGSFKPGHFLNMAKDVMKEKINCPIGIEAVFPPFYLLEENDFKGIFAPRKNFSNKGDFGYVALMGGSAKYSGAVKLSNLALSALRAGAGVVKLAVPEEISHSVMPYILESTLFPLSSKDGNIIFNEAELKELTKATKAMAIGMGIGVSEDISGIISYLLKNYTGVLIIDADGLNTISQFGISILGCAPKVVLTPHLKEFSRLTGLSITEIQENPVECAKKYAKENGCIALLKGPCSVITDGETVYLSDRGCGGMATAGSGDVLSGICAGVCGYEDDTLLAVASSAFINGLAGEIAEKKIGSVSMTAGDTVSSIPEAILEITK